MRTALIAADEPDGQVVRFIADLLKLEGFTCPFVSPIAALPEKVTSAAQLSGRVDVVVVIPRTSVTIHLISSESVVATLNSYAAIRKVRSLHDDLSFQQRVRAKTTPIVMLAPTRAYTPPPEFRWFRIIGPQDYNYLIPFPPDLVRDAIVSIMQAWRQDLLHELDRVGFAVTEDAIGRLRVSEALVRNKSEGEILCPESNPKRLRRSKILLLSNDFITEVQPFQELEQLLDNYRLVAKSEGTQPETVLQRFFERNPHLIYRGVYDSHWSKPLLPIPGGVESFQPDFVLRPAVAAHLGTNWEVLDLKLPDAEVLLKRRSHRKISHDVFEGISQLRDYRRYFNARDARNHIERRFGFVPQNPNLALVIGRRTDPDESQTLAETMGEYPEVKLVSYDDLLEHEVSRLALEFDLAGWKV